MYSTDELKEFAALDDYQRAKASKDANKNADKDKKDQDSNKSDQQQQNSDEPPSWFVKHQEEVNKKLEALQKKETLQGIQSKIKEHAKLKNVPASFLDGRSLPEKEEDVDSWVDGIVTKWEDTEKAFAEKGFVPKTKPVKGGGGENKEEKVSPEMSGYLKDKKAEQTKT